MDSKVIIAIAVAAVVVAAGAGVAIYVMNKDNDDPKSDYSLLTSIKTDGVKGGLYYITEKDSKGFYQKTQIITSNETTANDIYVTKELTTKYSDYTRNLGEISVLEFTTQFFDFLMGEPPAGVTVTKTDVGGGNMKYVITGEGKVGAEGAQKTVKFTDDFYVTVSVTSAITDGKGTATVDGKYIYGYTSFDYDSLKWKFDDGKAIMNGKYTATFDTDHYTSTDDFVDAVFEKFDASLYAPMIVETKDVNYKGVDCKEYILKATIPVSIEGKVHALGGYMIDSEGKENGEASSEKVQIYYI